MLDHVLPLNRKERCYTGTVLPALVSGDGLRHVGRIAQKLGLDAVDVRVDPDIGDRAFGARRGRRASG